MVVWGGATYIIVVGTTQNHHFFDVTLDHNHAIVTAFLYHFGEPVSPAQHPRTLPRQSKRSQVNKI